MGKRKHGTATVPITFTTRHYDVLKHKENRSEYIDDAIQKNHVALEQSDNHVVIHRLQGAIGALRRLKYLREEMNGTE